MGEFTARKRLGDHPFLVDSLELCFEDGAAVAPGAAPGAAPGPSRGLLVMSYAPGGSADNRLKGAWGGGGAGAGAAPARLFSAAETVAIAYNTTSALAHIHAAGEYHFDVKPANILFASDARTLAGVRSAQLADFGTTKVAKIFNKTSTKGVSAGTEAFMAPEMHLKLGGKGSADVWSLGATLLALLTGHELGDDDELIALWGSALMRSEDDWDRAGFFAPDSTSLTDEEKAAWAAAPAALRELIVECLALKADARSTAAALLSRPLLVEEGAAAAREREQRRIEEDIKLPLEKRVRELEEELSAANKRILALQEQLVSAKDRIAEIHGEVDSQRARVAGLEKSLREALAATAAAEERAAAAEAQASAALARAQKAEAIIAATKREHAEELAAAERKHRSELDAAVAAALVRARPSKEHGCFLGRILRNALVAHEKYELSDAFGILNAGGGSTFERHTYLRSLAEYPGQAELCIALLNAGADVNVAFTSEYPSTLPKKHYTKPSMQAVYIALFSTPGFDVDGVTGPFPRTRKLFSYLDIHWLLPTLIRVSDINAVDDKSSCTALWHACDAKLEDSAQFLIDAGADVNKGAQRPLSCFKDGRMPKISAALLARGAVP